MSSLMARCGEWLMRRAARPFHQVIPNQPAVEPYFHPNSGHSQNSITIETAPVVSLAVRLREWRCRGHVGCVGVLAAGTLAYE